MHKSGYKNNQRFCIIRHVLMCTKLFILQ